MHSVHSCESVYWRQKMNTQQALLALKIGCKVRSVNWKKGEYIELEASTGMCIDECKLVHIHIDEIVLCYDPEKEWELFNDNSTSNTGNEDRLQT